MKASSKAKKTKSIGIMPAMLLLFITALLICISLTILAFSLIGTSVYARIKARAMLPQLRSIASTSADYMGGATRIDDLFLLTRTSDAALVILDENAEEYLYHDPKRREGHGDEPGPEDKPDAFPEDKPDAFPEDMPDGFPNDDPEDMPGHDGFDNMPRPMDDVNDPQSAAQHDEYVSYCKSVFSEVMDASEDNEFIRFAHQMGVVTALPIESNGQKIGAAYLITPLNDLTEASRSVVFALVISSAFVTVLMMIPIYFFASRFTRPIKKMTKAALALADGNYSERVEVDGPTEVRELGESFNTLVDNLREKIGDLVVERNRLRAILEGMSEGIIGMRPDGSVLQHNNSALELLGGKDGENIESLPAYERIGEALRSALHGCDNSTDVFELGERTLRVSVSAIREEVGEVAGSVALIMDVTEAERLEQTRRDYVANVSHELRTPLASIRGIADMLNDGLVKNEADKERYYGYILKESMRLSNLINDLLELSRLQSGGVALELRRVELYELVCDVADRMSDAASYNDMSVRILAEEGLYYAHTNADRLEQVLVSLTDNAIKHGESGGCITIGIEPHGSKWHVYVENPAEVDQNDIAHLFDRFYKADTAHTGEGTGLGLAITREVLELMGEKIWIDYSEGIIRFTFTAEREKSAAV